MKSETDTAPVSHMWLYTVKGEELVGRKFLRSLQQKTQARSLLQI